ARAGGIPEVVEDGVTGFLAPVGDVDAMAHAALQVLRDRDLYLGMGAAGRHAALTRFHPDRIVPRYLAAYARTVAQVD
ncbi:MAG: glycosyltransferase, partial [Deinococcota bacterium]